MGGEVFKQKYFQQWEIKDLLRQAQLAGEERFQVLSPTLAQEKQSKDHRVSPSRPQGTATEQRLDNSSSVVTV